MVDVTNPMYGKKHKLETILKMRECKLGRNNPMFGKVGNWKGDNVTYSPLHRWIRKHLPVPSNCQECDKETKYLDCANVTGVYNRELINWKYLCRACHIRQDGRINNLKQYQTFSNN